MRSTLGVNRTRRIVSTRDTLAMSFHFQLGDAGSGYEQECRYTDETDDCTIISHVEEFVDVIMVDVEPKCELVVFKYLLILCFKWGCSWPLHQL